MDPRLRAAVDASVAWYDDIFDLHGIPTRSEDGLWRALAAPPPWHSGVKTMTPGVEVDRVVAVLGADTVADMVADTVADSFGELDLRPLGYDVLIDATWVHHAPVPNPPSALPTGWSVVRDLELLAAWNDAHEYAGVLLPAVLDRPAFTILARWSQADLVGGAVVHRPGAGTAHIGLSNAWSVDSDGLDQGELLSVVASLHPGAGISDYEAGSALEAMLAAGYVGVGPQLVWHRTEPSPSGKTEGS